MLGDAIQLISRTRLLSPIKTFGNSDQNKSPDDDDSAVPEDKSLNAVRTALHNLEDQLEFFPTIQTKQRVGRDATIARLDESRIILARRLEEHYGKRYKVREEGVAFVGDVHGRSHFVSPENLYGQPSRHSAGNFGRDLISLPMLSRVSNL